MQVPAGYADLLNMGREGMLSVPWWERKSSKKQTTAAYTKCSS